MFFLKKKDGQLDYQTFKRALDVIPVNIMIAERNDFKIIYANKTSLDTLRKIESDLPIKVDDIIGNSIDIFHKNPGRIRQLLSDPNNLPHYGKIQVGDEYMALRVSPVKDEDGNYLFPILTWSLITDDVELANKFETSVQQATGEVSKSSHSLEDISNNMASASEEMSASIQEILSQTVKASEASAEGVKKTKEAEQTLSALEQSSDEIGTVIKLIQDIAEQTNLLALNATIEAARAGEAGKGFAVVAGEVKALSNQTADATQNIATKINHIQATTGQAAEAIRDITKLVERMNEFSTIISSAVQEQEAASSQASLSSTEVLNAVNNLSNQATMLSQKVDDYLVEVRSKF